MPAWRASDILLTGLAPAIWGTTYYVTTEFLPSDRPLFVSVIRALPVGLALLVAFRQLPRGVWLWRAVVLGALNIGIFFALLFSATYRLPGTVIAIMNAAQPVIVAILARIFLNEALTTRVIVAACAGLLGVSLIVLAPATHLDLIGVMVAMVAVLSWAAGTILTKRWGQPVPLLAFTAWQLVVGGLILMPVALLIEGPPPTVSTKNVAGFLYLGVIGTGLAYALWFRGIERLKASTVSFLTLLSPVSAVTVDFLILRKRMTVLQWTGAAIAVCSIFVASRRK